MAECPNCHINNYVMGEVCKNCGLTSHNSTQSQKRIGSYSKITTKTAPQIHDVATKKNITVSKAKTDNKANVHKHSQGYPINSTTTSNLQTEHKKEETKKTALNTEPDEHTRADVIIPTKEHTNKSVSEAQIEAKNLSSNAENPDSVNLFKNRSDEFKNTTTNNSVIVEPFDEKIVDLSPSIVEENTLSKVAMSTTGFSPQTSVKPPNESLLSENKKTIVMDLTEEELSSVTMDDTPINESDNTENYTSSSQTILEEQSNDSNDGFEEYIPPSIAEGENKKETKQNSTKKSSKTKNDKRKNISNSTYQVDDEYNFDGFYDDIPPLIPSEPDRIPIDIILKVLGYIAAVIASIIFLIYYF